MAVDLGWQLGIVLAALVAIATGVNALARTGLVQQTITAGVRAVVQLAIVGALITTVISRPWSSLLFVALMFLMAVATTSRRVEAPRAWPWAALAIGVGTFPVVALTIASGVVPLNGLGIIPIAGIVIGNTMTAHTLLGRRAFTALREDRDEYEGS